jgi:predicted nucleotidyltransferase
MHMLLQKFEKEKLIHPPRWLSDNTCYLTVMGSTSYGVSTDSSDMDVYGFCIPPKHVVFPHLAGVIPGFGTQPEQFNSWQQHHVLDTGAQKEYDFTVFSIVKMFDLAMANNPNVIDSLFTSRECVLHSTQVSELVRSRRKEFLHKGAMAKLRGYAYAQLNKVRHKSNSSNPKRAADVQAHGMDTKFAYHVCRLVLQCEQILLEGDLDLMRNREILKSVRRGEWSLEQLEAWFATKEKSLEIVYANSKIPHVPDEENIKRLLLECLEMHYGDLSSAVKVNVDVSTMISELEAVVEKYRKLM